MKWNGREVSIEMEERSCNPTFHKQGPSIDVWKNPKHVSPSKLSQHELNKWIANRKFA